MLRSNIHGTKAKIDGEKDHFLYFYNIINEEIIPTIQTQHFRYLVLFL